VYPVLIPEIAFREPGIVQVNLCWAFLTRFAATVEALLISLSRFV